MQIQLKDRLPIVTVERGKVHVENGAFTISDVNEDMVERIPVASISCVMLQPGTSISHAAVCLAAKHNCLLLWVGDAGVRVYSSGAVTHNAEKIVHQATLFSSKRHRSKVAKVLYNLRFGGVLPIVSTIEKLRGIEGARTAALYKSLAAAHGLVWTGRTNNSSSEWKDQTTLNRVLNVANSALYGLCEAGILMSGYSPAIGFMHCGNRRSFVFDIADVYKFSTVVPMAFQIVANNQNSSAVEMERLTRHSCKRLFWSERLLEKLVPTIESVLR